MGEKRFIFTAVSLDELAEMRQFIEKAGQELGGDGETIADLIIAANEATTNIIVHGYGENSGEIEIVVSKEQDSITVTLLDSASFFDPTQADAPDLSVHPIQRTPGGLGILMIQEFVDHFEYQRTADGKNKLIMTKGGSHGVSS